MNNTEFIKKYGKFEFKEMCKMIPLDLMVAYENKEIGAYKIYNKKKIISFYNNEHKKVTVDFATFSTLGLDNIKNKGAVIRKK